MGLFNTLEISNLNSMIKMKKATNQIGGMGQSSGIKMTTTIACASIISLNEIYLILIIYALVFQ